MAMISRVLGFTMLAAAWGLGLAPASAALLTGSFQMRVQTGGTGGRGFEAVQGANPFLGATAQAQFTYTGTMNFDLVRPPSGAAPGDRNSSLFALASNGGAPSYGISDYSGSGTYAPANADYGTLDGFLAGTASNPGYGWASLYVVDIGMMAAGTVLTITHDDGVSVYQDGVRVPGTKAGPTARLTQTITLGATADTILYYSRQNGMPSVLIVDAQVPVPEPMSLALLGLALAGVGLIRHVGRRD